VGTALTRAPTASAALWRVCVDVGTSACFFCVEARMLAFYFVCFSFSFVTPTLIIIKRRGTFRNTSLTLTFSPHAF
jgi:hypothetical protein